MACLDEIFYDEFFLTNISNYEFSQTTVLHITIEHNQSEKIILTFVLVLFV